MEYFLLLIGLGTLAYVVIIEGRRKRDAEDFEEKFKTLTREFDSLHHRLHSLVGDATATTHPVPQSQSAPSSQPTAASAAQPAYAPLVVPKPVKPTGEPIAPPVPVPAAAVKPVPVSVAST